MEITKPVSQKLNESLAKDRFLRSIMILGTVLLMPYEPVSLLAEAKSKRPLIQPKVLRQVKELLGNKSQFTSNEHYEESELQLVRDIFVNSLPENQKPRAGELSQLLIDLSSEHKLDPLLLTSLIKVESGFNPKAIGNAGELGLMQIKPSTAAEVIQKNAWPVRYLDRLLDPSINLKIGSSLLGNIRNRFDNHPHKYLSAYNIGPTKVRKLFAKNSKPKAYVHRLMKEYSRLQKELALQTKNQNLLSDRMANLPN
jgi:soluble lytic murein transglycosylase